MNSLNGDRIHCLRKLKGIELSRQSTRREKLTRDSVTGVCIGFLLLKFPAEYQLAHMCEETVEAREKRTPWKEQREQSPQGWNSLFLHQPQWTYQSAAGVHLSAEERGWVLSSSSRDLQVGKKTCFLKIVEMKSIFRKRKGGMDEVQITISVRWGSGIFSENF